MQLFNNPAISQAMHSRWLPVLMLFSSNIFMTFAWYGHLKFKAAPLWLVVLASWGIAFFEYCLMVPANRWGNTSYSAVELKVIQEVITLTVFCGFAILYLREKLKWNHIVAFVLIIVAVGFAFLPEKSAAKAHAAGKNVRIPQSQISN